MHKIAVLMLALNAISYSKENLKIHTEVDLGAF